MLRARQELGSDNDAALVESFVERIEDAVAARAERDVERRAADSGARDSGGQRQLALGIVSAGVGIPVTAISLAVEGGMTGLVAMLIGWGGLVGVNVAHAVQSRRP